MRSMSASTALSLCLAALCLGASMTPRLTAAADSYNRCGSDYGDAISHCDACPGGEDGECGAGEQCFKAASYPACPDGSGGDSSSTSGSTSDNFNRCGTDYDDAVSHCSPCPSATDSECGAGEKCYSAASYPACSSAGGGSSSSGSGSTGDSDGSGSDASSDDSADSSSSGSGDSGGGDDGGGGSSGSTSEEDSTSGSSAESSLPIPGTLACSESDDGLSSNDAFAQAWQDVYAAAEEHGFGVHLPHTPDNNELVTGFFRSKEYNNANWKVLAGLIDSNFVNGDAAETGVSPSITTCDPAFDVVYHADHLGASIEGVLEYGAPTGDSATLSDFMGWGGDVITFYVEWYKAGKSATFCEDTLFHRDPEVTSFSLGDFLEDADAYNVGAALADGDSNVGDLVASIFNSGGALTRLKRFGDSRFGSKANAIAATKDLLTGFGLSVERSLLINSRCSDCPMPDGDDADLGDLIQCFVDKVAALADSQA